MRNPAVFFRFFVPVIIAVAGLLPANLQAWNGRNLALRDIPDRTWQYVCPFEGYSNPEGSASEVPWAYDANSKVFVRVGGCTNRYSNGISLFDIGTLTWSLPWPDSSWAPWPGRGCNRGTAYDPITKLIWTFGGASSEWEGGLGFWKGDMATREWTCLVADRWGNQAHVAADTADKKIVLYYWDLGCFKHCKTYDPVTGTFASRQCMPNNTDPENSYYVSDYWYAFEYVPVMNGCLLVNHLGNQTATGTYTTWLVDTKNDTCIDLAPNSAALPTAYPNRIVLSYDPVGKVVLMMVLYGAPYAAGNTIGLYAYHPTTNAWEDLTNANMPACTGWSEMFEYDPEHNVHVMCQVNGGNKVWAYRYQNEPGALAQKPVMAQAKKHPALNCRPNPFSSVTHIDFDPVGLGAADITICDINGHIIKKLPAEKSNGSHSAVWNGSDENGMKLPNGTYFVQMKAGSRAFRQKLIYLK